MIHKNFPDGCVGSGSTLHPSGHIELLGGSFKSGHNLQLHAKVTVKESATCTFGNNCTIRGRIIVEKDSHLTVGDGLVCNGNVEIRSAEGKSIHIGNDCLFANPVIYNSDMHSIFDISSRLRINFAKDIFIAHRVWLAQGSRILKGSYINNDSVVAADSLVNSAYPANSLIGGSPARVLKTNISWHRSLTDTMPIAFDDDFSQAGFISAARNFDHDQVIDMGIKYFEKWPQSTPVDYHIFYYLARSICEKYVFTGVDIEKNITLISIRELFGHCFTQSSYLNMPCGAYSILIDELLGLTDTEKQNKFNALQGSMDFLEKLRAKVVLSSQVLHLHPMRVTTKL